MIVNYHTHTYLCNHAIGNPSEYVLSAIEKGFKIIGISDHGPLDPKMLSKEDMDRLALSRHMDYRGFDCFINDYLKEVDEAIQKYKDRIKIYKAVELEYVPNYDEHYMKVRSYLDYMNLGAHIFFYKGKVMDSYNDANYETLQGYADTVCQGLNTGLFDILVHPDLFMYRYVSKNGNMYEWDEKCEKVSRQIIECAIKNNVKLEVNCGAVRKGKNKFNEFSYPRSEFWKIVNEYKDVKIVIGRDAHDPIQLNDEDTKTIEQFARDNHINVIEDYDIGEDHV